MIRTRDFLVFSGMSVFLLTMITATAVTGSFGDAGTQVANVGNFAEESAISGASVPNEPIMTDGNIARLKSKIAAGEGDVSAGEPVFTSVDDVVIDNTTPAITDQTPPESIQIGHTVDGQPLYTDALWRFVGYSQFEQVGVTLNGIPIYGARSDNFILDECDGGDDGSGYKYFLNSGGEKLFRCLNS